MIYGQARGLAEEFREAGFEQVAAQRVPPVGRDTWRHGYLVTGYVVIGGVRTLFSIRSARTARMFLKTYGPEGEPVKAE